MTYAAKREIVNRIESIAAWRKERGDQDRFGFGPEVAIRHKRSADGLDELARYVDGLDSGDDRIAKLVQFAFSRDMFEPGATLLTEVGRFRFHDPSTSVEMFLTQMVEFAQADASEARELGGQQVEGDNPWRADFEIRMPNIKDN